MIKKKRRGLLIIFFFALIIIVPVFKAELYPFSLTPVFSTISKKASHFIVLGPEGYIPTVNPGLSTEYSTPFDQHGLKPKESINHIGEYIQREEADLKILENLERYPQLSKVKIFQVNINTEGKGVNYNIQDIWSINNPHFSMELDQRNLESPYKANYFYRFNIRNPLLNPFRLPHYPKGTFILEKYSKNEHQNE